MTPARAPEVADCGKEIGTADEQPSHQSRIRPKPQRRGDQGQSTQEPVERAELQQRGREITFKYLAGAEKVLGGAGFKYVGEWLSDKGAVLEFEREIEGIRINGVDIITFSDDGRLITHFKVMIRPLKAINLLHRLMGEQLAKS